jgi:hypothetical protein
MIPSLQDILSKVDVKPLNDLLSVASPHDEPLHDAKTVKIIGLLMARNSAFIGLQSGDMIVQIACNAVKSAKLDPSPPAVVPHFGKYVILEVVDTSEILIFRKSIARDMGSTHGERPLVLSVPSKAKDYAAAVEKVDQKNKARADKLEEEWKPIPFTLYEPISGVIKSEHSPASDKSFPYNVNSPYDTKETKALNTPFETLQTEGGTTFRVTDYKIDESVDTSTDYNSDVRIAKGNVYTVNSPFDTKNTVYASSPFDTLPHGGGPACTDYSDDYRTEVSQDYNADLSTPDDTATKKE